MLKVLLSTADITHIVIYTDNDQKILIDKFFYAYK